MNRLTSIMILIILSGAQHTCAQTKIYKGTLGTRQIEMHLLFEKVGIFGYYTFAGDTEMQQLHSQEDKRNKLLEQDELYGASMNITVSGKTIKGTRFSPNDSSKKQLFVTQTGTEDIS